MKNDTDSMVAWIIMAIQRTRAKDIYLGSNILERLIEYTHVGVYCSKRAAVYPLKFLGARVHLMASIDPDTIYVGQFRKDMYTK